MLKIGIEVLKLTNLHLGGSNRVFLLFSGSQQFQFFFSGSQQFFTGTLRSCDGCSKAKAKAKAVSKVSTVQAVLPGERIFVDTSGPYKKSIVGSNYWILVVDQFSGKSWSFFVKKKNLLSKIVDELLIKLFAAKYVIKYLRCDNAGENLENLSSVCTKHGI